jgi:hypothetical protein
MEIIEVSKESFEALQLRAERAMNPHERVARLEERVEALETELRAARDTMFAHGIGNWERCEALVGPACPPASGGEKHG